MRSPCTLPSAFDVKALPLAGLGARQRIFWEGSARLDRVGSKVARGGLSGEADIDA